MLLAGPSLIANAAGLKVLSEEDLSKEVGRDGLSFATSLQVDVGSYVFTPYDTAALRHENITVRGTFCRNLMFFRVVSAAVRTSAPGLFPESSNASPPQIEYDLVVSADGRSLGTAVTCKDFVPKGSKFEFSTGPSGGVDLGWATKLSIGQLLLSPNGRASTDGQMEISGIKVEGSETPGSPWVIANLKTQSGKFRLPVGSDGESRLNLGVDWPVGADAATGRLSIDKVAFSNGTNLGAAASARCRFST
ncbi:MAG: hypothetical protein IPH54_14050 [Rhodoferax sp.]|nr:hypothetical protein [Rhodoferax sp.]